MDPGFILTNRYPSGQTARSKSNPMKTHLTKTRLACLFTIACMALSPLAQAVEPPPDGGYPDENTAEGEDALFTLVPGSIGRNTAVGFQSLYSNTTGYHNTGVGDEALHANTTGFAIPPLAYGHFTRIL
jgi:hypothetical protein